MSFTIRLVRPEITLPLRQAVLRPGRPLSQSVFDGDDEANALHLGAFSGKRLVGVASFFERSFPSEAASSGDWQLRGMAVADGWRGRGCGRALLRASLLELAQRGGERLWCNARVGAVGFYHAEGFEIVGDQFEIEDVGPHFIMRRSIAPHEEQEAASST